MSHAATNWAIRMKGLKPATKVVLWHLADRHNGDTGRCDPSQQRLAEDAEMSRSSLNTHLSHLEKAGLIRRITSIDPKTKRQRPTSYELAMDVDFTPQEAVSENETRTQDVVPAVSKIETRAVSRKQPDPCPDLSQSRVQNLDTNPVREPGRKPVRAIDKRCAAILQHKVSEKTALDFVAHRRAIGKVMTEIAAERMVAALDKMPDPEASMNASIMSGWSGVFETKPGQAVASTNRSKWKGLGR